MDDRIRTWTFGPGDGVPDPVAPFAHATQADGRLYVTGQMPIDPATGEVVGGGIAAETDQVMRNLVRVLELCGSSLELILMARAYLVDFDAAYAEFNDAYRAWFPDRLPSRTCVGVSGLAVGAHVEIDFVALPGR